MQTAGGEQPATEEAEAAGLPFDPFRLVGAILRGWPVVVVATLALTALGLLGGMVKVKANFTATASLMRQETTGAYRASDVGEAYKPRQVSTPTLISLMKSPALMMRVSERTQPHLSAREIVSALTITPERSTDLSRLTFVSSRSPQAAVNALNLIGDEVIHLTCEMQSQEAASINNFLSGQLAKTEDELRKVNEQLLSFSRQSGLIDADKEIDADLRTLGDLELRCEGIRIEQETLDLRIQSLEKEVLKFNPLAERLQVEHNRLIELEQIYTASNPLVVDQQERVVELEKEVAATPPADTVSAPQGKDRGLTADFYRDLITLRAQKQVLSSQLEKLRAVRDSVNEKLRALPEKGMEFARIRARQQSLETSRAMLASRQREAKVYAESPLSYFRFFPASVDDVAVSGRRGKWIGASIAGGILGLVLGMGLLCVRELLDDRVKTQADARRATRLPVLASLPELDSGDEAARRRWATKTWPILRARMMPAPGGGAVCGVIASELGEGCSTWIALMAEAASLRGGRVVAIVDSLPAGATAVSLDQVLAGLPVLEFRPAATTWIVAPPGWLWTADSRRQWQARLEEWLQAEGLLVLVELPTAGHPESLLLAETLPQLMWLLAGRQVTVSVTREHLATYRAAGCRVAGVLFNREGGRLAP